MLLWLAEKKGDTAAIQAARDIETGMATVLAHMQSVTPDLGGTATTEEMGEAVCRALL